MTYTYPVLKQFNSSSPSTEWRLVYIGSSNLIHGFWPHLPISFINGWTHTLVLNKGILWLDAHLWHHFDVQLTTSENDMISRDED